MDTSSRFLVLGLIRDHQLIASVQEECWKRQSEEIFPKLIAMTEQCGIQPEDIGQVVITEGPGSYTGVRIAMTVAKVFCVMADIPLYTIGTLQLFAGKENARVVLDARGGRVYTALIRNGRYEEKPHVASCEDLKALDEGCTVIGDGSLIGKEDFYPDLAANFLSLESEWIRAENTNLVRPEYLKSSEAYLVK